MTVIGEVEYTLKLSTKDFDGQVKEAEKKAKTLGQTIADGAKKANKAALGYIGGITAGLTALTVGAVKSFADYEQLTGGVETLFKESSEQVMKYASTAYKTAGLSANAYMETVTSFSASLLQSLGGDTAEAARVADMAVTDMADNANKMGTSIESIQYAYQGFAKQNYTMLDNLKLGYGGTASEMARLINDSGVMGDTIVTTSNLSEVGFAKMAEAIHKVQSEMDITGTTAKEAEKTISGSFNSMKAAWSDFTVALANPDGDVDAALDTLIQSAFTFLDNVIPAVQEAIGSVFDTLWERAPILTGIATALGVVAAAVIAVNAALNAYHAIKTAVIAVQKLWNLTLGANPIFLLATVIATVTAGLALFLTQTEVGRNILKGFGEFAGQVFDEIGKMIGEVGAFFTDIFTGIGNLFNTVFGTIYDVASSVIGAIGGFFSGLWNGIEAGANGIKHVFEIIFGTISGIIKAPINGIIEAINGVLSFINSIQVPDWVPGIGGAHTNFGMIPKLATGGIVNSIPGGQIVLAGEAGEDEWVVPESKMASMIAQLTDQGIGGAQSITINVSGTFATSAAEQRKVAEQIATRLGEISSMRLNKSTIGGY